MDIELPYGGWEPRDYQLDAWRYLFNGGKHAELIWNRRSGKDEISLHWTCIAAHMRIGGYWHMLPLANQARRAIWDAINPRTGRKRIDDAFPKELRKRTRDSDMFIEFKNGSTWQVLGSDNYEGAIGSTPCGIVYSEWALAKPNVRGFLRPIIAENDGWQMFITTPRGKNHAYRTYTAGLKDESTFSQLLNVHDTKTLTQEQLDHELSEYISTYGKDQGTALYEQEYLCSFDAAILGAYYGPEFAEIDRQGRICKVPHEPNSPVYTAWDLGFDDDTAIWFYQIVAGEVRVLEYYYDSGKTIGHYMGQLLGKHVEIDVIHGKLHVTYGDDIEGLEHRRKYNYAQIQLPHDAAHKTLAAQGKSILEQVAAVFGVGKVKIFAAPSIEAGIQAVRLMLKRAWFDVDGTEEGVEALRQYRREWDDDKRMFRDAPLHDWTSHPADAIRTMAVALNEKAPSKHDKPGKTVQNMSLNDLWSAQPARSSRI